MCTDACKIIKNERSSFPFPTHASNVTNYTSNWLTVIFNLVTCKLNKVRRKKLCLWRCALHQQVPHTLARRSIVLLEKFSSPYLYFIFLVHHCVFLWITVPLSLHFYLVLRGYFCLYSALCWDRQVFQYNPGQLPTCHFPSWASQGLGLQVCIHRRHCTRILGKSIRAKDASDCRFHHVSSGRESNEASGGREVTNRQEVRLTGSNW